MTDATLRSLVERFVEALVPAIRAEMLAAAKRKLETAPASPSIPQSARGAAQLGAQPSERNRRSQEQLRADADRVLAYIRANPNSRAEKIRAALGWGQNAWYRTMRDLVTERRVAYEGEDSARVYRLP
jgi:hypothetical protein